MFLLDTNVVSELRRRDKADMRVLRWAAQQSVSAQYLSAITVFEIQLGILQKERRDPHQGALLRSWFRNKILENFARRILPFDAVVAQRCAELHIPNPQAERDAIIAATALEHGMTIVTRNVDDFRFDDLRVFNPWE